MHWFPNSLESVLPYLSTIGVISLAWNIISWYHGTKGFMKLKMECRLEKDGNESGGNCIICKTSLENTSRRPVKIDFSYILIKKESLKTEDFLNKLGKKLGIKNSDYFEKKTISHLKKLGRTSFDLESDNYDIIPIEFYFKENWRLGSFETLSSSVYIPVKRNGLYSIYFLVLGKRYLFILDTKSVKRAIHDLIIIQ